MRIPWISLVFIAIVPIMVIIALNILFMPVQITVGSYLAVIFLLLAIRLATYRPPIFLTVPIIGGLPNAEIQSRSYPAGQGQERQPEVHDNEGGQLH